MGDKKSLHVDWNQSYKIQSSPMDLNNGRTRDGKVTFKLLRTQKGGILLEIIQRIPRFQPRKVEVIVPPELHSKISQFFSED